MTHSAQKGRGKAGVESDIVRQGPLTWGQQAFWAIELYPSDSPRFGCIAEFKFGISPGVELRAVRDTLNALFRRHESLRTTYRLDEQLQLVHAPRPTVDHEVIRVADAEAAAAAARDVGARPDWQRFDLEREAPLRVAIILVGGAPVVVRINAHHIAVDGTSGHILRSEFAHLLDCFSSGRSPRLNPSVQQPIDLANDERAERGQRANAAALRHLARQYATMPNRMFPSASTEPLLHQATMESPVLATAERQLSDRLGAPESTVLLAAIGAVLGHLSGHQRFPMMATSSNRFTPDVQDMVASLAQHATIGIDLTGDPSFAELVDRVRAAAMSAHRHGRYDFMDMVTLMNDQATKRGVSFSPPPCFNYRSDVPEHKRSSSPPESTTGQAGPGTRLDVRPIGSARDPGGRDLFMMNVYPEGDATVVNLVCNATMLPAQTMTDFLLSAERVLTTMAGDPERRLSTLASICDIEPVGHTPGWVRVHNCWVCLPAVAEVLCACPGIKAAAVTVSQEDLVAYVAGDDPPPAIDDIHGFVVESLTEHPSVITPHSYVLGRSAPADQADIGAWQAQEALHRGRPAASAPL